MISGVSNIDEKAVRKKRETIAKRPKNKKARGQTPG
jgi:hypothetical protein